MLKAATLFTILATLAHVQAWKQGYPPEDNSPCYVNGQQGSIKGALCGIGGLSLSKRLLGNGGLLNGVGLGKTFGPGASKDFHGLPEGSRCNVGGGKYGVIKDALCIVADLDLNTKRHSDRSYGFGWFHPGPLAEGDRCWSGTGEGIIHDSLCIVADLDLSLGSGSGDRYFSNGWFNQPYHGYGHPFGWYHPGPFVEGDKCVQNGKFGFIQNAFCVAADLDLGTGGFGHGLAKRFFADNPDYWHEPYFYPGYGFGWFHEGPFQNGDRCWQEGRYGSVTDSLCVLADLEVVAKRDNILGLGKVLGQGGDHPLYREGDRCFKHQQWGLWKGDNCDTSLDLDVILAGRSLFADGAKCWHQGHWGVWKGASCSVDLDVKVEIRSEERSFSGGKLFRDDPWLGRGVPCTKDGKQGILRDAVCIIAEVGINVKRDEAAESSSDSETAPTEGSTTGWEYDGNWDDYVAQYNEDYEQDPTFEKRLLSYSPGDNKDHTVAKTINKLLTDVKTRGLVSGSDKPSVYGNGAPPKDTLGELGLGKLLGGRALLGSKGFTIEELAKTLEVGKRGVGGLGDGNTLGGLLGGGKTAQGKKGDLLGGLLGGAGTKGSKQGSGDLLGGLL